MRSTRYLALRLLLVLPLASCYKDDVDIAKLNTNALDPEYGGPPMFTILTDSTYQPSAGVFEHYLKIQVDASRLPYALSYDLRVEDLEDGTVTILPQTAPGAHVFDHFNGPVTLGGTYCYDISLWVQVSSGRKEQYCGIAEL